MNWKRLRAYISGSVDQELLLRDESLATENRILRDQIQGRLQLNDSDRISMAKIGQRLASNWYSCESNRPKSASPV